MRKWNTGRKRYAVEVKGTHHLYTYIKKYVLGKVLIPALLKFSLMIGLPLVFG